MLSPRYLEGLSDEIVEIYAQLEADILQDMARRIARLGKVTEATKWQAQLFAETGALKKRVNALLKKYDPAIQKEIKAIYNDALIKNARADNRIFTEALGHGVSDINAQVMLASIQKTHSDLSRLTITTAYTTEQQFVQQANNSYMQVVTGAFDYDSAMKNACNNLARDGITGVQYMNGKPVRRSIEAAVRMNILTGVNQTASAMTMSNCDELGCDLVETTAHIGARPSHEEWQGQIFSLSGTNPKYRPFSVCNLGEPDGICGINCRHSYYPFFEGLERHYTQSDLDEMENVTVEYNGQKMSRYDAEQELRGIERNIRKYKRQALTQAAGGVDNTHAREMIGKWQATARDFTQQTKIERDSNREFIGSIGGKQPRGIITEKPASPPIITDKMKIKTPSPIFDYTSSISGDVMTAKTVEETIAIGEKYYNDYVINKRSIISEISKYKEMGINENTVVTFAPQSDETAVSLIKKGMSYIPTQAANTLIEYFEKNNFIALMDDRGYFDAMERKIVLSEGGYVAPHEMAHALESINNWVLELEKEFYNKRTAGEDLIKLKDLYPLFKYKDNEKCKKDNFVNAYIGRDYKGGSYEILSMGLQLLLENDYDIITKDKEYFSFIIGIILRL